jgi:replicative DNA helicase
LTEKHNQVNIYNMAIYSIRIERHVLGGIIKNPDIFPEIERFVNEHDFYSDVHNTIFCVVRDTLLKKEKIDKVILAQKIINLGITFKDEISIADYIETLSLTQITPKATTEAAQELLKLRVRRGISEVCSGIDGWVKQNGNLSLDEIVTGCDSKYNEIINSYETQDEPHNIFEDLEDVVEERGNNPVDETGFQTSYPEFNRLYGGLRPGNLYAIVARPGQGKSTWISDMALKAAVKNNIEVLVLDTEMYTVDIQFRMVAAISGVPVWYLETGNWRKNADFVEKVREAFKKVKDFKFYHYEVGNKNIDQVCALVRRWYFSKVKRGEPCIIAYDYIKLTGERVGSNWAEHQAIGDKIDKLKKLAEEVNAALITAMQMNRSGERGNNSAAVDDSSAIALSDRLQWFASFVAIFRQKTPDEILEDGQDFGTHKLIPLKTRFQGKDAAGHQDLFRRTLANGTQRFMKNYLNYDVINFDVSERGSLRDVVQRENEQFLVQGGSENDGDIL